MTFGQRLKMLRIRKELTQSQLAEMINLSKANISKYEAGQVEPNLETIRMISVIFDISIDFLLGKSDNEQERNKSKTQVLSAKQEALLQESLELSDKDIAKVLEYAQLLKLKRNL